LGPICCRALGWNQHQHGDKGLGEAALGPSANCKRCRRNWQKLLGYGRCIAPVMAASVCEKGEGCRVKVKSIALKKLARPNVDFATAG